MALFIEYERLKNQYLETQEKYAELLTEKELLFARTQPGAIRYDKDVVTGGECHNKNDEYLVAMERKHLDEQIEEIRKVYNDRLALKNQKYIELKQSKDELDITYLMKYIENRRIHEIANKIPCSESSVFNYLRKIRTSLQSL